MTRHEIIERLEHHLRAAENYREADVITSKSSVFPDAAAYQYLRATIRHLISDLQVGVV